MADYSNSEKSKAKANNPEKVIEKLELSGKVTTKSKGIGYKFKTIFLGGDAKSTGMYVLGDVILPALRDLLFDSVRTGAEKAIYGESRRRRGRPIETTGRTQYTAFSHMRDPRELNRVHLPDQPPRGLVRNTRRDAENLIVASRDDAELIVERLGDIIDTYEVASVADLKELLDHPIAGVDNKWGWTTLNKVEIRQVREGYLIDLPPVEEI